MANAEHLKILKSGLKEWIKWRMNNINENPDLSNTNLSDVNLSGANLFNVNLGNTNLADADLRGVNLRSANLRGAYLSGANLYKADLYKADLSGANLYEADLRDADLRDTYLSFTKLGSAFLIGANLTNADLTNADLTNADLSGANLSNATLNDTDLRGASLIAVNLCNAYLSDADLSGADLTNANLTNANLQRASLIETKLTNANIEGAKIYGISAWDILKEGLIQKNLVITKDDESEITVDNLEVAQFIYLMLKNQNIRDVIDTLTSKAVLILGRFSDDRRPLLDAMKNELRNRNYLPILFDFEKPASRDLTETISILARMSRFVIADLTDAKSIPQELSHFVPDTFLPVIPIILQEQREYGMFEHFKRYHWVLPIYQYKTPEVMLSSIVENVIEPAERKVEELKVK